MMMHSYRILHVALRQSQPPVFQRSLRHCAFGRGSGKVRLFACTAAFKLPELSGKKGNISREPERRPGVTESLKPESIQPKNPASSQKQASLLSEKTVSNKEQRKADWAIIKEMSRYLWPKVIFHEILR